MAKKATQWIVRDKKGRIFGPFSTAKVLSLIERGFFSGGEEVAKYPGGDWYSISREPQFYDVLLEIISRGPRQATVSGVVDSPPVREGKNSYAQEVPSQESVGVVPATSKRSGARRSADEGGAQPSKSTTLDLVDVSHLVSETRAKRLKFALVVLVAVGLGSFLFLMPSSRFKNGSRVRLLPPRQSQPALAPEVVQKKLAKAVRAYQRDTFEGYEEAQNELVQAVEGAPRNLDALSFLCLAYRGLWPFAFQDAQDLQTMNGVSQFAYSLDPLSPKGAACKVSQFLISGLTTEAQGLTDSILEGYPGAEIFYQFRAELLADKGDFATAIAYTQKVEQLAPAWVRPNFTEATYASELQQLNEADRLFRKTLTMNPDHPLAKVGLARLQFSHFGNADQALTLLQSAVTGHSRLAPASEARARLLLAQIYSQRKDGRRALAEAQKCYALSSSLRECRDLVVQLGGADKLKNARASDREALFVGDEYAKKGDCFAAQAEYKAAYDADTKNAVAAFKAGQCLWKLNYSSEAMAWVQKAIVADPGLTDAYVALADYNAQRFSFDLAGQTLARIQKLKPRDYKVYYGYALVEYRRKNYKMSLQFLQRATELYNADVDLFILQAKNNLDLHNFTEAQHAAARAVELDLNNVDAHCVYAKVLAGLRGSDAGIDYIRHLVNDYAAVLEYQLALAEILYTDEKFADARDVLERLAKVSERSDVLLLLGQVYQKLQNGMAARQSYLTAATLDVSDGEALFRLGQLYLSAGQAGDAAKQFTRVLDINNHYPAAHVYLGKAFLQLGQIDKAQAEAKKEKQLNPYMADAYILAGDAYEKSQQYADCASEYQKAIKLRPDGALIYVHMAKCYRQAGDFNIALAMLKIAAQNESGNPEIYKEQGALYEMKGEADAAAIAYEKYLNLAPSAPDRILIEAKIGHHVN